MSKPIDNPYSMCWSMQNASNCSGVCRRFVEIIAAIRDEVTFLYQNGIHLKTERHPAYIWMVCKLADMGGFGLDLSTFSFDLSEESFKVCKAMSEAPQVEMESEAHLRIIANYAAQINGH